jgi:hypothetical protein
LSKRERRSKKPSEYDYARSALANGIANNLQVEDLWNALGVSKTGYELEAAITATIKLKELCDEAI